MSKIYDSEFSIQKEILNAIGGDATKKYDSPYEIQLAILDTIEGGGSGATYTAGSGISISESNEISVDTNTIQPKLTAGDGIEISGNTISCTVSGGGSGAIEDVDVLPDPAENKDKIVRLSSDGKLYYVDEIKAIKFTALENNSSVGLQKLSTNQTLEYSTDGSSWTNMTSATAINLNSGDSVYVRGILGDNNTSSNYTNFSATGSIKVSGNINTIWYYTAEDLEAGFKLKTYCGYYLFRGCTGLTDASELVLPATTLAQSCYNEMFENCANLVTSPILPATTLIDNCYYRMFRECRKLSKITCLATNISFSNCTYDWVTLVSSTGTFYKNPEMSSWTTGGNGIPNGWTVEDYTGSTPEITYDLGWSELVTPTLVAGSNISITDNKINALGYTYNTSIYSFAEGIRTTASGRVSHAEGENTYAYGENSHVEGNFTYAYGVHSHAEGGNNITENYFEHAEGHYNKSHKASNTTGDSGNTQHSVGIGASNSDRKNAFEIMQNGDIYAYGVGGYVGVDTKAQDATIKTLQEAIPVIVTCTQAEYEQITPDANTIYLIVSE